MRSVFSICLLLTTAVSSQDQPEELHGIVGESVSFPAVVKTAGSLMYNGGTVGDVTKGKLSVMPRNEKFSGRLRWDSSLGLFSLAELKMDDSGEYKVQSTDLNNIIKTFKLNVYNDNVPVSKPQVTITHNKYRCSILCTTDRGTQATLSWYREGEEGPIIISPVHSAPDLYLPQTVEWSDIYTCVARNSVSNETSEPLTVGAHCRGSSTGMSFGGGVAIGVVICLIVCLVGAIIIFIAFREKLGNWLLKNSSQDQRNGISGGMNGSKTGNSEAQTPLNKEETQNLGQ